MNEFDFLKEHGFGVVYGAEAVKNKIIEIGHLDPTRKKTMNAFTPIPNQTGTATAEVQKLTDQQLSDLLKIQPADKPVDGQIVGYVVDESDADEAEVPFVQ